MRNLLSIIILVAGLCSLPAYSSEPTHFSSVSEMIADFNDYSAESNSFEVISNNPLHIRLSPFSYGGDSSEVTSHLTKMAAIYGIYRSFIHTDINEITVTSVPVDARTGELLTGYEVTVKKSRKTALSDLKKMAHISSFSELTTSTEYGNDSASKLFNQLLHDDQGGIGVTKFFKSISSENAG